MVLVALGCWAVQVGWQELPQPFGFVLPLMVSVGFSCVVSIIWASWASMIQLGWWISHRLGDSAISGFFVFIFIYIFIIISILHTLVKYTHFYVCFVIIVLDCHF